MKPLVFNYILLSCTARHMFEYIVHILFLVIDDRNIEDKILNAVSTPSLVIVPILIIVMVISIVLCTCIICLKVKHGEVRNIVLPLILMLLQQLYYTLLDSTSIIIMDLLEKVKKNISHTFHRKSKTWRMKSKYLQSKDNLL